mmetsp:Transcript_25365/g.59771  ORF Transcript_25365/g.59771 Transcript_25365/m.59771 type:complete len:85 (+) Transcript_25365:161-415(+)
MPIQQFLANQRRVSTEQLTQRTFLTDFEHREKRRKPKSFYTRYRISEDRTSSYYPIWKCQDKISDFLFPSQLFIFEWWLNTYDQ